MSAPDVRTLGRQIAATVLAALDSRYQREGIHIDRKLGIDGSIDEVTLTGLRLQGARDVDLRNEIGE